MSVYTYSTKGVCSREIAFEIKDGLLLNVRFKAGCSGNLQGISRLAQGMAVEEVIEKLRGIDCGGKGTSCPDQLSKALMEALQEYKKGIA